MLSSVAEAINASRGEDRIPLPTLSNIRIIIISQADVTSPVRGRTRDEIEYPIRTKSFLFLILSDIIPLTRLSIDDVDSATPSITPSSIAPDPSAATKTGTSG